MTDKTADEFSTANHNRLAQIAAITDFFVWIVFIVHILLVIPKFVEANHLFLSRYFMPMFAHIPNFWDMLSWEPLYVASLFIDMLSILLQGAVYGLTLKGISLGLYMIIETDLVKEESINEIVMNDDTSKEFKDKENTPVFYKPKEVITLAVWLNRVAAATVVMAIISVFSTSYHAFIQDTPITAPWKIGAVSLVIVTPIIGAAFQSTVNYFSLKALASILKILMEMEFNFRGAK